MGKSLTLSEIQSRADKLFDEPVKIISEYKNIRTPVVLKCLQCGHTWSMSPKDFIYSKDNAKRHHCPQCFNNGRNGQWLQCAYCGKQIYRSNYQIERNQSGYFYCTKTCGNLHKNKLRLDSGEWDDSISYRAKAFTAYKHECLICGWNEDERVLEVHHIDENRLNNKVDNLCILCPTCHRKITLGYYTLNVDKKQLFNV